MNTTPAKSCICNQCGAAFKISLKLPFNQVCKSCKEVDSNSFAYDEETELEIYLVRNSGGRVPAVFDSTDDSFGY